MTTEGIIVTGHLAGDSLGFTPFIAELRRTPTLPQVGVAEVVVSAAFVAILLGVS